MGIRYLFLSRCGESNEGWVGGEAIGSPPYRRVGCASGRREPTVLGEERSDEVRPSPHFHN